MALTKVNAQMVNGAITTDSSGNVGIGTTTPASILDVKAGSSFITARSTSGIGLKTYYDDGRTTYTSVNYDGTSTSGAQDYYLSSGQSSIFRVNTNSSTSEAMRIDTYSQVLIGTNSALSNGGGCLQLYPVTVGSPGSGNQYGILLGGNGNQFASYVVRFLNTYTANIVGSIVIGNTATAYNTSSDYRLKEDIAPMQNALATVSALKPVTYKWKADGSSGQGFIAHELSEVIPQAVTGKKDAVDADGNPEYQGIDTSFLVATLTAAIQELKAEVDQLKTQLAAK